FAIAAQGPNIYVGGYFTNISGVAATNLARWDGSAWSQVGGGLNSIVYSILPAGNDLYVGGIFFKAGDVFATNIARWNGANWSALGNGLSGVTNGFNSGVLTMATNASGHLIAGGVFLTAGGVPVNNIAEWDGTQWLGLAGGLYASPAPTVSSIAVRGNDIYVAGSFRSAGGLNATNL